MKKFFQLAVFVLLLLNGTVSKGQINFFSIYTTAPEEYCHGQYSNILYPSTHTLGPGTWRFEWYKLPGSCAGNNYGSVVGNGNDYYVGESGMYTCIAYEDIQGLTVNSMNFIVVRVLPSYPYFPYGPMFMPAPQYYGNANCVTSLQLCIPLTGNISQTQPSVVWYKDNVAQPGSTALTYTATSTGYYKYKILSSCSEGFSDSVLVTVGASPDITITPSSDTEICSNTTIPISVPYQAGLSYQWKRNGVTVAGATSNVYTTGSMGTYSCVISGSSCGSVESNSIYISHKYAPSASFSGLASTYLVNAPAATLSPFVPGGTFSGQGISGNTFSPSAAGVGTHTITYNITATNGCQNSYSRTTTVNSCPIPATPSTLSGPTTPCSNTTGKIYSCSAVSGATSYTWSVPASATIVSGQGTTSISVNFGSSFTSGTVSVAATNSCGTTGSPKTLAVYGLPATPTVINGQNPVCAGTSNVVYTIPLVTGATSYTWFAPTNGTIVSGQGTNQVTVSYNTSFTSGSLGVRSNNACGTSGLKSALIYSLPNTPGPITGPTSFCSYQQGVAYSISAVPGATTYEWQVPTGATVATGQGTTSITVNFGNKAGKLKVRAGNACGLSSFRLINLSKNCRIGNFETEKDISIYPNPSSGDFIVSIPYSPEQPVIIEIYDINGKLVIRQNASSSNELIQGDNLLPGIYSAVVSSAEYREIFKIVKTD
ncbi:MAG: T9SS type A sorting domain-containing protein [Bacteroidota bacterium]|nr:T9SS type A sorting domain-containing protein [Bacteroidota bacterium]